MVVFENGRPKLGDLPPLQDQDRRGAERCRQPAGGAAAPLQAAGGRRWRRRQAQNGDDLRQAVESELEALPDGNSASGDLAGDPWAAQPDLIIVDGGKPQLNAAVAALGELDVRVPVIGIAKENHGSIGTYEEIYLVSQPEPLVLPRGVAGAVPAATRA